MTFILQNTKGNILHLIFALDMFHEQMTYESVLLNEVKKIHQKVI